MESGEGTKKFELVFEGPGDDSVKTLQRLKGTFVSDLEFPVEEVQRILANAPIKIFESEFEDEVTARLKALKKAGAKVLLIQPKKAEEVEPVVEFSPAVSPTGSPKETVFEIDEIVFEEPAPKKPSEPKVYELDVDDVLFNTVDIDESEEPEAINVVKIDPTDLSLNFDGSISDGASATENEASNVKDALSLLSLVLDDEEPKALVAKVEEKAVSEKPVLSFEEEASLSLSFEDKEENAGSAHGSHVKEIDPPPPFNLELERIPEPIVELSPSRQDNSRSVDTSFEELELENLLPESKPEPTKAIDPPARLSAAKNQVEAAVDDLEQQLTQIVQSKLAKSLPSASPVDETTKKEKTSPLAEPESLTQKMEGPVTEAEVDAALSVEALPARSPSTKGNVKELILPLCAGAILLIVGNWIYWTFLNEEHEDPNIRITADILNMGQKKNGATAPVETLGIPFTFNLVRSDTPRKLNLKLRLLVPSVKAPTDSGTEKPPGKIALRDLALTIEPEPLPPQTPEEIVQQKAKPPWIYKLEVLDTPKIRTTDEKSFTASAPAKFYIEEGAIRRRSVGNVVLTGELNEARDTLTLGIQIVSETAATDSKASDEVPTQKLENGRYMFKLNENVVAPKIPEQVK